MREMRIEFWCGNMHEKYHLENVNVDARVV